MKRNVLTTANCLSLIPVTNLRGGKRGGRRG